MTYNYECVWTDEKQKGFTVGKIYRLDTKNVAFYDDFGRNWYVMTIDTNTEQLKPPEYWSFEQRKFELVDVNVNKKITFKQKGNMVIAKMGNKKGIARCSPEDKFDYYTGCKIALDRLFGKEKDKDKVRTDMIQPNDNVKIINTDCLHSCDLNFLKDKALPSQ